MLCLSLHVTCKKLSVFPFFTDHVLWKLRKHYRPVYNFAYPLIICRQNHIETNIRYFDIICIHNIIGICYSFKNKLNSFCSSYHKRSPFMENKLIKVDYVYISLEYVMYLYISIFTTHNEDR